MKVMNKQGVTRSAPIVLRKKAEGGIIVCKTDPLRIIDMKKQLI